LIVLNTFSSENIQQKIDASFLRPYCKDK